MTSRKISWNKLALIQFNKAIEFIAEDSIQNAEKVRVDILQKIEEIPSLPEKYPPDKYKLDNNGNYRAFELYHYRIAYYIAPLEIRILRVRHTSREPLSY